MKSIFSRLLLDVVHLYDDEFVVMPNQIHGSVWIGEGHDTQSLKDY